ncbi:hypothetical protein [Paenibacillus eucommiae]|uniref:RNA:NAD 2'-phosphotransferase (TPT1/KptA family) n=1 Tax=Paenibacillus eucommiae TaxID=1355755 RepID=A0ABS4J9M0_9BACL|nr:hypothetical protein [Paenibacillus eucommiae]MBP1995771.1 RNA:NAD 2'-phosphotransferase (TPT1/KptA family) [Paenibacillus eucommiae]
MVNKKSKTGLSGWLANMFRHTPKTSGVVLKSKEGSNGSNKLDDLLVALHKEAKWEELTWRTIKRW